MNQEFKKIKSNEETRYVLETATAGATSSGAVATSVGGMGKMQKRNPDNILAQEADTIKVPVTQKPRQGPLKPQTGGGKHRDKKKEQKQGKEKHRKPFAEGNHEPDHEISMASNELKSITSDAMKLLMLIKRYSEMEGLQAWQQSKITKAADYLNSVLQSIGGEQGVAEGLDPNKRARLDDLINKFQTATDPSYDGYGVDDHYDPEEVINQIRKEFGDKIASQIEAGADKMHFPRAGHQHGYDPLSWKKPVDRQTKAGKMYKQDSDYRKNTIKSRYSLSGKSSTQEESTSNEISINGKPVDLRSLEITGIDRRDYPDFVDAYFDSGNFADGTPMSDEELDQLRDEHGDLVNQMAHDSLYESKYKEDVYTENLFNMLSTSLQEKAVSKAQQRFMGMVHAAQKGEKPASKEVAKAAKGMGKKDAKDFASTKHKGLPEKKPKK